MLMNLSESCSILNTFNYILWITVAWTILFACLADETTHSLIELWSFHNAILSNTEFLINNLALFGNSHSGNFIVTCDHSNSDTSSLALGNSAWDFLSDDIFNTKDTNKCESCFFNNSDNSSFIHILMSWASLIDLKVFIANTDSSKCLTSILGNNLK